MTFTRKEEALGFINARMSANPKQLMAAFFCEPGTSYVYSSEGVQRAMYHVGLEHRVSYNDPVDFIYGPPGWIASRSAFLKPGETIAFTMYEAPRMDSVWIAVLNQCAAIVVPTFWGASCLSAQGIDKPIHVVPLGARVPDTVLVATTDGAMRFGTVVLTDPVRKGLAAMLDAFEILDQGGVHCELQVRTSRNGLDKVPRNVVILRESMPHSEYMNWIQNMECGLFPSRAEGFGIPQLEFSVCGRCVIAPCAGAVGEFLPFYDDNLILDGNSSYAEGAYKDSGHWYSTPVKEIVRAVEYAVENRYHVAHVGRLARMRAMHFTWEYTGLLLKEVFFRHGLT